MRTCTVTIFLWLGLFTRALSQEPIHDAADRAAKLTDWMKTNLKLAGDQGPRVYQINLKYANKMEELKNSSMGSSEKMRVFNSYDKAKEEELKIVFTAEQYKIYLSKKKEIRKKFMEQMKQGG